MSIDRFRCYLVEKDAQGRLRSGVVERTSADLPEGDVLIRVDFSSLNYKDALAATGHSGVARKLPLVPGIDAAGTVVESHSPGLLSGDRVLVTGYDLGAGRWGGWAEYVRVPAEWVVRRPERLSAKTAMIYGTAGFTAAQCVDALRQGGVEPEAGEVVVTGASGGVGSLAVGILARLGYTVVASSGKKEARKMLLKLGAGRVVDRGEVYDDIGRALLSARWAGAVDAVGGVTLATLLRSTQSGGCVAACGLVGGHELSLTVYPFILRGVTLAGIDSAFCPHDRRVELWRRLAGKWRVPDLESLATEIGLEGLDAAVERILAGKMIGRTIVNPRGASSHP